MSEHGHHDAPHGGGHETTDVRGRPVLWGSAGLLVLMLVAAIAMQGFFGYLASRESRASAPASPLAGAYGRQLPPAPRLQIDPIRDLDDLHKAERVLLEEYAWVDREAGTARIPIGRALDLVAERGLPTWARKTAEPATSAPQGVPDAGRAPDAGERP